MKSFQYEQRSELPKRSIVKSPIPALQISLGEPFSSASLSVRKMMERMENFYVCFPRRKKADQTVISFCFSLFLNLESVTEKFLLHFLLPCFSIPWHPLPELDFECSDDQQQGNIKKKGRIEAQCLRFQMIGTCKKLKDVADGEGNSEWWGSGGGKGVGEKEECQGPSVSRKMGKTWQKGQKKG